MNRQQLLELARAEGHLGAEMMDTDKFARHHRVGRAEREADVEERKIGSRLMNQDKKIREALHNRAVAERQRQIAGVAERKMGKGDAAAQDYIRGIAGLDPASYGGSSEEDKARMLLQAAALKESRGPVAGALAASAAVPGAVTLPALTASGAGLIAIMQNLGKAEDTAMVRSTLGAELE